jgi:hypothetical protein
MEFYWREKQAMMWTCHSRELVTVKAESSDGVHQITTRDMGYITYWFHTKMWVANTYGTINPTSDSWESTDLEEAKRYVEEQAIVGITVNKLTR